MNRDSEQKQTVYNLISSVLIGGITFLTAPIFTRMLGPEQYGLFSVAFSWVTIAICIMGFQTKEALANGYIDFHDDYKSFRNSTLLLGLCISALEIAVVALFLKPISCFLGYSNWFTLIILLTAFSSYTYLFAQQTLTFEKKAHKNLLISVLLVLMIVSLSLLFISKYPESEKYIGRMLGFTIPYTLCALGFIFFCASEEPIQYNREYWMYSLSLGFPIIFHALSKEILGQTDKVMMQQLKVDAEEIGIYSFFFAMSGALGMIRDALNASWRPFYYDYLHSGQRELLETKCHHYIELFTAVTCGFLLVAKEVSMLMAGEAYQSGLKVLPIVTWCIYFSFIHQFPVNFELYCKKPKLVATGTVVAAVVNVILNALLIPTWGMYGAGAASAFSYFCLAAGHFLAAAHISEYQYHLAAAAFLPGVCSVTCFTIMFYFLDGFWYVRWGVAIVLGLYELFKVTKRKSIF